MSTLGQLWRVARHRLARLRRSRTTVEPPAAALTPGERPSGLVVTTFNRPEYVRGMCDALRASDLTGTLVAIVDDASTDAETRRLVRELVLGDTPIVRVWRHRRRGFAVDEALRDGWDLLVDRYGCRLLCNLDPDTLMKPDWLRRLVEVHERERAHHGPLILTGFNSRQHQHILSEAGDHCRKASIGGVNMLFDVGLYRDLVRPNLAYDPGPEVGWDWRVVGAMNARGYPMLCLRPSVIQHIGQHGRFSRPDRYDVADDY